MSDLEPLPRAPLAAALDRARGTQRRDFLLAQPDAASLVSELPITELHALITDVGLEESRELLALVTPEQVQGMLDLDLWREDDVAEAQIGPWLDALIDQGYERTTVLWEGLDPELAALILGRWTRIYDIVEGELPDDEEPPFFTTPDRFYVVKITAEDPRDAHRVDRLLDALYRGDMTVARHTLRTASSEMGAELEETALRFRNGRLADLGYADYYEALEVYRPLVVGGPGGVEIGEGTEERPSEGAMLAADHAEAAMGAPFLGAVLRKVEDAVEARRLEAAMVLLANRVLSADRAAPGDAAAAKLGAARASATLSLGLEVIARGDVARGLEALHTIGLGRIHRVGHTVGLRLASLFTALGPRAARAEEPAVALATALVGARPVFPSALDVPAAGGTRPLASLRDVATVTQAIERVASELTIVHDVLGQNPAALGPSVTVGDVGRTAIAWIVLGQPPAATPLEPKDVREIARVLADDAGRAAARDRVAAAFAGPHAPVAAAWLDALIETGAARGVRRGA